MHWTDNGPADWIDRVRPFVTASQHSSDGTLRGGVRGVDWAEFVTSRCNATASEVDAVVPEEAPNTETVVYVHVIGTLRVTCIGQAPVLTSTDASATLVVIETSGGWRVAERLY